MVAAFPLQSISQSWPTSGKSLFSGERRRAPSLLLAASRSPSRRLTSAATLLLASSRTVLADDRKQPLRCSLALTTVRSATLDSPPPSWCLTCP